MRIERYFAVLCSLLTFGLAGFFAVSCGAPETNLSVDSGFSTASELSAREDAAVPDGAGPLAPLVLNMEEGPDAILAFYRDPVLQDGVIAFFEDLTGSGDVAGVVLSNASAQDISPALAFALCYEESRYYPRAFNRNRNGTVDRGLFQLNSATFPKLKPEEFFDPGINAKNGLTHLRWCLNTAGTEVAGLAMYNAGSTRVRSAGTPKNTLDYISRILKRQRKIDELFAGASGGIALAKESEGREKNRPPFRLSLLAPLGR